MKAFFVSILAGLISSAIFSIIMMSITLDNIISYYPGLLSIIQTVIVVLIYLLCSFGYNQSNKFVDKHASDQSEKSKDLRHKVYKFVWLTIYIGLILIAFDIFNKSLIEQRSVYLKYGLTFGVITHEVKVFFLWLYEYFLAITFIRVLELQMRKEKSALDLLKESKKEDVLVYIIGSIILFLAVLL
ncbi:hypothetical protein EDC18_103394 [Natranaerovirga pectinivora]|uniref:Uncharacterized protein n=1 Tax=Natranaerovirga pectinivora TaxID=682400 RepID=A0A4R3MN14_9FIRM|nr:hypothetical protein [Natranaerovirga pectinivora]TCT15683.1 hypothetical protein EDC18_103394 [Natranaerovirga pectinivora]